MNLTKSINVASAMYGKSTKELADALCVSHQTVYNWKASSQNPRVPQLIKIAEFYGIKVSEFIALGE